MSEWPKYPICAKHGAGILLSSGKHIDGTMCEAEPAPKPEGVSLKATFADAVLASKRWLDEAAEDLVQAYPSSVYDELSLDEMTDLVGNKIALAEGYAHLAQALQHGAPGERL